MTYSQREHAIRFEWGEQGVMTLAPISDVVVIVDVLSFTTSVDIAVARGAIVFPYRGTAEGASEFAAAIGAHLAQKSRHDEGFTLSPSSLLKIIAGERIVLPSPNGSTLSLHGLPTPTLAGCLRNARAVAQVAQQLGDTIAVVAAGERWRDDLSLRPCFEDMVGAGAIISHLTCSLSPEAAVALAAFNAVRDQLVDHLRRCSSGKELIERGFAQDVELAAELNISTVVPILSDHAYIASLRINSQ